MRTIIHLTAAAVAAAIALTVLPAWAGKADNTLNIAWESELPTLDRYFNTVREGEIVARMVADALLFRDPRSGEIKGNLATSHRYIDDKTIEFELRKGVVFHNGEPFDADDVVYTLRYVADPANKVATQQNVNWIAGVEKLDPYKVRLTMKQATPLALEYLSGPLLIYPNEYYAKVGPDGQGKKFVGTGPYQVAEYDGGSRIVFKTFARYHGGPKGKPAIGTVVLRSIPERNTQIAELLGGRLDWIWRVPQDQAAKLADRPELTVRASQTMRIGYLGFDAANRTGHRSPVNDIRVRQAIAHAIDRKTIVKALVRGDSQVVHAACFPSQFGCTDEVTRYDYDPAKAKKLLAEAGYANGFSIDFHAYRDRPWAEAMIGFLKEVGIKANLTYLKYDTLRDKVYAGDIDFAFMTWGSYSINDVAAITSHMFKNTKDDYARDPDLHQWLAKADAAADPTERKKFYALALKRIAEKAYWLPLFTYDTTYVHSRDLDFSPTADEIPRFFWARWK